MKGTKVGAGPRHVSYDEYVCTRCGRQATRAGSKRTTKCADCLYVLAYREREPRKPPRQYPTHLTDEECRVARLAFRAGDRTPETEVAAREYWRRQGLRKRQRATQTEGDTR